MGPEPEWTLNSGQKYNPHMDLELDPWSRVDSPTKIDFILVLMVIKTLDGSSCKKMYN